MSILGVFSRRRSWCWCWWFCDCGGGGGGDGWRVRFERFVRSWFIVLRNFSVSFVLVLFGTVVAVVLRIWRREGRRVGGRMGRWLGVGMSLKCEG